MTRYEKVQEILERAVGGRTIHAHGNFWRNVTRDQFIAKMIPSHFDPVPLLIVGNGVESNLVKALRGTPPFGDEIESIAPRMPYGMLPVAEADIAFIETWITEGCLEDEFAPPGLLDVGPLPFTDETHVSYWRDFDLWSLIARAPDVNDAIENRFQPIAGLYFTWARQPSAAAEQAWAQAVGGIVPALTLLSARQVETAQKWYGIPANSAGLFESYERFGNNTLPPDAQRPEDPEHTMNGRFQWFVWAGFADGCLRHQIQMDFWDLCQRAILIGLLNDGLFRRRFRVNGFAATEEGKAAVRAYAAGVASADLPAELRTRFREATAP